MSYPLLRRWLVEHTPLEPSLLEGAGFEAHASERMAVAGCGEPDYISLLKRTPDEIDRLIAGIAVPETWLFRYPRAFDLLADFLSRRLASGAPSVRMLSIGCATGQEAYCMAMTALHAGWPAERVRIEAIDRSADALRIAAAGEYPASSIRSEIPGWATSFLQRSGEVIRIDPIARTMVRTSLADASDPAAMRALGSFEVIFCRNVLIYFNAAARANLLESISDALSPCGLLFTGHAEQMIRSAAPLRPVSAPHAFALEKSEMQPAPVVSPRPVRALSAPSSARSRTGAGPAAPLPAPPPAKSISEPTLDDARDLADAGRAEDAEALIRSIAARHAPSADALELLGLIRMAQRDSLGAKRCFEQAVYLEPGRATSLLQLAIISERSGDPQRAATLWDRARRAAADVPRERRQ